MATLIVRQCDRHLAKGDQVPAEPRLIGFDGQWSDLDLCQDCMDELASGLREAVNEWGARVDTPPARNGKRVTAAEAQHSLPGLMSGERRGKKPLGVRNFPCLWCPLDYAGPQSLGSHMIKQHGIEQGQAVLLQGYCPLCGNGHYEQIGGHAVREHDGLTGAQVFVAAAEAGDPYGHVATALALAEVHPGGLTIAKRP